MKRKSLRISQRSPLKSAVHTHLSSEMSNVPMFSQFFGALKAIETRALAENK